MFYKGVKVLKFVWRACVTELLVIITEIYEKINSVSIERGIDMKNKLIHNKITEQYPSNQLNLKTNKSIPEALFRRIILSDYKYLIMP